MEATSQQSDRRALTVLICGALILAIAMGVRHTGGLFLTPISSAQGWPRESFALAIAIQNLVWGIGQPFAGALADRYGAVRVLVLGVLVYMGGLFLMAYADGIFGFSVGAGLLVGLGLSGTTFGVILGAVGRSVPQGRRSMALGLASAGGSLGQFMMLPIGQASIDSLGWQGALIVLAAIAASMLPLSAGMRLAKEAAPMTSPHGEPRHSLREALREAVRHPSFHFLFWSFFVCGFHTAFIMLHMPSFIRDEGFSANLGMRTLALIGLFNIAGSFLSGWLGGKMSKKGLLAFIYAARGIVILGLLYLPMSEGLIYAFGALMGLLWLGTVPLTNGLIGQIFGMQHVSMLYGIVFFGHQIGSFLGAWLGGVIVDRLHSYDVAWWIAIGLAVVAAALSWPVREQAMIRMARTVS